MPAYGSVTTIATLSGSPVTVWNAETVPATGGNAQISVAVGMHRDAHLPNCFSVEVKFAADPASFAIEVQTADTNEDAYYVTKATLNTGLNATFAGRIEVTNVVAKFVRLRMATKTNAVAVTARLV